MPLLTVELRGASGKVLDRVFDEGAVARVMALNSHAESVCLRFIDPFGVTVFNPLQAAVLRDELNAVLADVVETDDRDRLTRVVDIADGCAAGVHVQLWCIGD